MLLLAVVVTESKQTPDADTDSVRERGERKQRQTEIEPAKKVAHTYTLTATHTWLGRE